MFTIANLDKLRGQPVTMLEIGVFDGGSLDMWRRYLGFAATIVGVDINPRCADLVDEPNIVCIGSQADRAFLEQVIARHGAPDLVLDDGPTSQNISELASISCFRCSRMAAST